MTILKFLVTFLMILMIFSSPVHKQNSDPYVRLKSIKCDASNESVSGYNCFIKAHSRTNTTMNIFVNLTRPIYSTKISYGLTYKSLSNSQRTIINVSYELCSVLNGSDSNPVFQWVMGNLPALQKYIHACPYEVKYCIRD